MIPTPRSRARLVRCVLAVLVMAAPAVAMLGFAPAADAQPPAPQTITVPIRDLAFTSPDLMVHVGDTVTWVNEDRAPHDVTTTSAPVPFASSTLTQGQSFSYTFTTAGTYSYVCTIHENMSGAVTVMESEAAAPAAAPVEAAPPEPQAPADAAPAAGAPAEGAPAGGAPAAGAPAGAATAPGTPAAGAAPAPGAASAGAQPVPETTQAVGAVQPGRQLDPLLIVAGFAMGIATLCLLLISPQSTGALSTASGGAAIGGGVRGPAGTATMAAVRRPERDSMTLLLRALAAAGLLIDAYVHFDLASGYDAVGSTITQGMLFRVQGVVAMLAAMVILLVGSTRVYQVVFLIAVSALVPVVLYTYVDLGALGPLPSMYEPVWYPAKKISAIGEAVAAVAAAGLFMVPALRARETRSYS